MDGYARSYDEAHLYMLLRPCDCGETELDPRRHLYRQGDAWIQEYSGFCPNCGRERRFSFRMPAELPPMGIPRYGPDDEPSQLLDPGEWLVVSDGYAERAEEILARDRTGAADRARARGLLAAAVAALDEVVKFVPDGAGEVPSAAFRRRSSAELRQSAGDRFGTGDLAGRRAMLTGLLAELADVGGQGVSDE